MTHDWKVRLGVAAAMLAIAFCGVLVPDSGWGYWKWAIPIYALLALGLSFHIKRQKKEFTFSELWHELAHWSAMIVTIFLVSYLAQSGVMSHFVAGVVDLLLLSLAVFLAGIYIEPIFLFIGLGLAVFAMLTALLVEYMFMIAVIVLAVTAALVAISVWSTHRKSR